MLKPCKYCKFPKCVKCWDKGYSTEMIGKVIASGDFIGQRNKVLSEGGIKMNFCKCERGKQLKRLLKK